MSILVTRQLAHMSCHCPAAASQRISANPGLVCSLWTSAHYQVLRSPARACSSQFRRMYACLKSATAMARRFCLNDSWWRVGWRGFRPGRLSDRNTERCGLALAASWFTLLSVQSECDQVDFDLLVKNKILSPDEEQTGWDRLVAMYTLDEMGGLTPELELVRNIATAGLLIGGSLGAMLNGRLAVIKFVERNQATPFESQLAAKRALQDRVTLGMARGFFMFGWRTALFTSAFTLVSTTLMVYTNQISAFHYACGGVVAGAMYKANMGLRGMTAGAVAGGLLGVIGGGLFSLTCYLTDTTLPKLRYQQYLWKYQQEMRDQARAERKRERRRMEAEKKLKKKEEDEITQSYLQESVVTAVQSSANSQESAAPASSGDEQSSASPIDAATGGRGMAETQPDSAAAAVGAGTGAHSSAGTGTDSGAGTGAHSGAGTGAQGSAVGAEKGR